MNRILSRCWNFHSRAVHVLHCLADKVLGNDTTRHETHETHETRGAPMSSWLARQDCSSSERTTDTVTVPPSRPFQCKSVCPCQHVLHIIQCNPVKRLWSCFLMSYTSYFHSGGCFTSFGGWQGRHQPEGHVTLLMTQIELWEELLNPIRLSQVVSIKRLIYARFISYPIFLLILFISDMCFFSPGADGAMCSQPDFEVPRRRFWNYTFGHFMSFCIL